MNADASVAHAALNRRYLLDYPAEAARQIERMSAGEAAELFAAHPLNAVVTVWQRLAPDVTQAILLALPEAIAARVLTEIEPAPCAALLNRMDEDLRQRYLALLDPQVAHELKALMAYPAESAGQMMNPRVVSLRPEMSVDQALTRLRRAGVQDLRDIFMVDANGLLAGRVQLQDLAMAEPEHALAQLQRPIIAAVNDIAPRDEVVELLQRHPVTDLPVVDHAGRLVGLLRHNELMSAVQEAASADVQTMVGASADERALSPASFAVKKRLPWLQINLLTAFLAASVVGLFEGTIAKFTALAVLLPVVAGQSGNAGAQALAVTMRGLVLREISLRHWPKVVTKEVSVGLVNGLAVAATTGLGVYFWSGSAGLVLVICAAMVISMVAAGLAGALVPITLRRLGQDPATSSSIILTTVTDVVGFFSFLGIATLFAALLPAP